MFSIIAQESENLQWSRENVERFVDFVGWVKVRKERLKTDVDSSDKKPE